MFVIRERDPFEATFSAFTIMKDFSCCSSSQLPSLRKQDPRYFYKGSGSARSRLLYPPAFVRKSTPHAQGKP
jgi:hypothetical protein